MAGFRVDPTHEGPQFYTLLAVGGDNERPLVADGRIIFFVRTTQVHKALAMDPTMAVLGNPPRDVETMCDVAQTLYLVNSQDDDPDGVVLDCLLIFDDLVRATQISMPERYQGILTELAARLTEGESLKKVFSSEAQRGLSSLTIHAKRHSPLASIITVIDWYLTWRRERKQQTRVRRIKFE